MNSVFTTHIGSLPFRSLRAAFDYTMKFDIPVLFSLPALGKEHFMGNDLCCGLDLIEEKHFNQFGALILKKNFWQETKKFNPPFLEEFLKHIEKEKKPLFKYQLIGPYTLFQILEANELSFKNFCSYLFPIYEEIIQRLAREGLGFFMFDEPSLATASKNQILYLKSYYNHFSIQGVKIGIHTCSKLTPFTYNLLNQTCYLHVDYSLYSIHELRQFKAIGAIGISKGYDLVSVIDGGFREKLNDTCLIAPSCGLYFEKMNDLDCVFNHLNLTKEKML
ncbi:MAG: hypothetical protein QF441_01515 [Bacteriovoracaceae bacterium]|jgi:hypothetical protein|nr:hypothetical protein [Halobacteriovoraceae bacterium]MDP7319250.1 hypothetical protein [Bacteriovoracaceae bacterium]|tara:strand:+ start:79 stop:909 length:831 start_codon:yes stop_codon:yes gene_type:complete